MSWMSVTLKAAGQSDLPVCSFGPPAVFRQTLATASQEQSQSSALFSTVCEEMLCSSDAAKGTTVSKLPVFVTTKPWL